MNLGENNLISGVIPSTIGLMTNLESILLSLNSFGAYLDDTGSPVDLAPDPLPTEIGTLNKLVTLDLSNNFFHPTLPFDTLSPLLSLGKSSSCNGCATCS